MKKSTENSEENLVKKTCRELGITQKELAEKMGVHDVTVRNWSSKGEIPNLAKNFINLLLEKKEFLKYVAQTQKYIQISEDLKGVRIPDTL
jgi:transcriptional regulator with XRE-family HTH domain